MKRVRTASSIVAALAAASSPAFATELILKTGDPLPNPPGGSVANIQNLYRNNAGSIAAQLASPTGDAVGIFAGLPRNLHTAVVRVGQAMPGRPPAATVRNAFVNSFNQAGGLTMGIREFDFNSVPEDDFGQWYSDGTTYGRYYAGLDPIPGSSPGENLLINEGFVGAATPTGYAVSQVTVFTGPGGPTVLNDQFLLHGAPGNMSVLYREDDQVPGLAAGVKFANMRRNVTETQFNSTGAFVHSLRLRGTGVTTANDGFVFKYSNGALIPIAREGDPAPNAGPVAFYRNLDADNQREPLLSSDGHMSFETQLDLDGGGGGFLATFIGTNTANVKPWHVMGDPVPGLPGVMSSPGSELLADKLGAGGFYTGRVDLEGTGVVPTNNRALLAGTVDDVRAVIRKGDSVPGLAGVTLRDLAAGFIRLNDNEQIIFQDNLAGTDVNSSNDSAVFGWDSEGGLQLLYREGDPIDLGGGQFVTPSFFTPAYLLDNGAVGIFFEAPGGISGVIETNIVPEPASGLLALLPLTLLNRRLRQKL